MKKELNELNNLLSAYLSGWKSIVELAEWLAGVDWGEARLDAEARNTLGRLELLVTDVTEGLRPEQELLQEAALVVSREGRTVFAVQPIQSSIRTASSSNNAVLEPVALPVS